MSGLRTKWVIIGKSHHHEHVMAQPRTKADAIRQAVQLAKRNTHLRIHISKFVTTATGQLVQHDIIRTEDL